MKTPVSPRPTREILGDLADADQARLIEILGRGVPPTVNGRYRHWDTLRQLTPPEGLSHEEWWLAIKLARRPLRQELPLADRDGNPFGFVITGEALRLLRQVDRDASGQITLSEDVATPEIRRRYLVSSLMEEAITSSQLEGAATSRRVAKDMIRSGRAPATRDEQMILNNYRAMQRVRERLEEPLDPALVLELHRIVSEGTLDDARAAGRLQTPSEERVAIRDERGKVLFSPPPAEQLPDRLERLCAFANGELDDHHYVHPVVRAILLHFWLGHDHPFLDGNGRTARLLFYWSLLRDGYWLIEHVSISRILRGAPSQYARSYLYSEWDDNDATYFVMHQLAVTTRAIEDFNDYLYRKMREVRDTERLLDDLALNHRQIALLSHALRHPDHRYTFRSHATSHGVVYQSARTDLLQLEELGILRRTRRGKTYHFRPVADVRGAIEGAATRQRT